MLSSCSCNSVQTYSKTTAYDPSRTLTLRNKFAKEMMRRFKRLAGKVRQKLLDNDIFYLSDKNEIKLFAAFPFSMTDAKMEEFMQWLETQINNDIFQVVAYNQLGESVNDLWMNMYLLDSYQRGVQRARSEMSAIGMKVPSIADTGGIYASMSTPFHMDRLGVIYSRSYEELKGITDSIGKTIRTTLTEGIANGDGPAKLARMLYSIIGEPLQTTDSLGRHISALRRAEMIARTETIRAHHVATIQEYRNWALEKIYVQAEWRTATDNRVCSACASMHKKIFTLDQIQGMIPKHPNCRCIALPILDPEKMKKEEPLDKVAAGIKPEYRKAYLNAKERYLKFFKGIDPRDLEKWTETGRDSAIQSLLRSKMNEDFPDAWQGVVSWQATTKDSYPMGLKKLASEIEENSGPVLFAGGSETPQNINPLEYLKLRAFNQAYMEVAGITEPITLMRGTDGRTGASINMAIKSAMAEEPHRTVWKIKDDALTGYTSNSRVALRFAEGGVSVRLDVPVNEIVVHRDLLSRVTGGFLGEEEFILLGYERVVKISDIMLR